MRKIAVVASFVALAGVVAVCDPSVRPRHEQVIASTQAVVPSTAVYVPSTTTTTEPPTTTTEPPTTTTSFRKNASPKSTGGTVGAAATQEVAPSQPLYEPGRGSAEDAVNKYFGDVFDQAWGSSHNYGVTTCESGHDPGAVSSGGANYGLFQINKVHQADFEAVTGHPFFDGVFDPFLNSEYARHLYDADGGWKRDWSCAWAAYR